MPLETTNYQCPSCGGPLRFASESGSLQCDHCGSQFTPEEAEEYYQETQAKHAAKAAAQTAPAQGAPANAPAGGNAQGAPQGPPQAAPTSAQGSSQAAPAGAPGVPAGSPSVPAGGSPHASAPDANAATSEERAAAAADPIQNYLHRSNWNSEERDALRAYTCSSCGAELLTDKTTAVTSCPYCGNPTVLPGQLDQALRPEYVIPFKLNKQQAIDALRSYYQGKKLLPKGFTDENHLQEIQGVYVPFWLFSGTTAGSAAFNATRTTAWADSRNTYVKTDFFKATREGCSGFDKVPVDASSKMPDAHMDAIEPFDYSELKPFSMGYLPGYLTDRYDEDAASCQSRADARMQQSTLQLLQETVTGYESVTEESSSASTTFSEAAYALLPVWMLHTTYQGEDLLFALNGQTGRIVGDLPVAAGKVVAQFLITFLPSLAILLALVYFVFLR